MYDAWAIFNSDKSQTYLIGKTVHGFDSPFDGFSGASGSTKQDNMEKAISYAAYRLIEHRYKNSPQVAATTALVNDLLSDLGLDPSFSSEDYTTGSAAALGNYIASEYIRYGLQDGANEAGGYENQFYSPVNDPLFPEEYALDSVSGNPALADPNRWQPLEFSTCIDQSGEPCASAIPDFLGPEWGIVSPFSLKEDDATIYKRDGFDYWVYHDPGPPPHHMDDSLYQWNFAMVAVWSGHLDATFNKEIDISPASIGNFDFADFPTSFSSYDAFYQFKHGGDTSQGRSLNPITELPYTPQMVKLGDYGRILAEFWADGPDSETPPGHWFTLVNYVSDNISEKKFNGQGETLSDLEWDLKVYFLLGGAMHDVAITAWGIKGYYDYIRPVSAIRYMASLGQSSDPDGPNYHAGGLPLVEGYIDTVSMSDPIELRGNSNENVGKVKLFAWRGPGPNSDPFIADPETDIAGVDWILADQWWPYQRPTFITPPFAGYVSGHSTYSRAAAELLTLITGSPYFPDGMGEFDAPMNQFLVFEDGPSQDITLQWATYQDASDQCSLSRIWGGIHPSADDIPGRLIGYTVGTEAYDFGTSYFTPEPLGIEEIRKQTIGKVYPNPTSDYLKVNLPESNNSYIATVFDFSGKQLFEVSLKPGNAQIDVQELTPGNYILKVTGSQWEASHYFIIHD